MTPRHFFFQSAGGGGRAEGGGGGGVLAIGLFHLISIHPPRKSVNYVGGVNIGQKLMCPRGVQLKSQIVSRGV